MSGTVSPNEMMEVLRDLATDDKFISSKRLWDLREATGDLVPHDTERLARLAQAQDGNAPGKVALVAASDLVFGMSRVFEVQRTTEDVEVGVFRDLDEAELWLQED